MTAVQYNDDNDNDNDYQYSSTNQSHNKRQQQQVDKSQLNNTNHNNNNTNHNNHNNNNNNNDNDNDNDNCNTNSTIPFTPSSKLFRANLDDVEQLSYGKGAKHQRGTGSRSTCHRLNREERRTYDQAKRDGYLITHGSGYRRTRKGSPVANTFRQRCDARAELCIVINKRRRNDEPYDSTLMIDFSTLRVPDDTPYVLSILQHVFQSKYPEFYHTLLLMNSNNNNKDKNNNKDSARTSATASTVNIVIVPNDIPAGSMIFPTTICPLIQQQTYEVTIRVKPIWAIQKRILTIECDTRDVAKSLAHDILKVSSSGSTHFDSIHYELQEQHKKQQQLQEQLQLSSIIPNDSSSSIKNKDIISNSTHKSSEGITTTTTTTTKNDNDDENNKKKEELKTKEFRTNNDDDDDIDWDDI